MWCMDHVNLGNRQKLSIQALRHQLHLGHWSFYIWIFQVQLEHSLGGKRYIMVVVDDFTRYTQVILLRFKSDAPEHIEVLCRILQNEKSLKIDRIRSDHGKEFKNSYMKSFCTRSGISQEFFASITPQQNGVVERKNKVIQEMAGAILHNKDVARKL